MGSYEWAHEKLVKVRGKPSEYGCSFCDREAAEWAYDHRNPDPEERVGRKNGCRFSLNPEAYIPICHPCHVRFDKGDTCKEGHVYSEENTYWYRGHRYCRTCRTAAKLRYRAGLPEGHPEKHVPGRRRGPNKKAAPKAADTTTKEK